MQNDSSVTIRQFDIEFSVPREMRNPQAQADRLERIVRHRLPGALETGLQSLDSAGEAVVLIRRLQCDFEIETLLGESEILRLLGDRFKSELLKALSQGTSKGIAVFHNQAHYLSSALLDMVRGRARQLWYYRYFDGLWALPLSAALRTALLDEPSRGLVALAQMDGPGLLELTGALNDADARRVLDGLFADTTLGEISTDDARVFIDAVAGSLVLARGFEAGAVQPVLLLACLARRHEPALTAAKSRALAECFLPLLQLHDRHGDSFQPLLEALLQRRQARLRHWLSARRIAELAPLLRLPLPVLRCLAQPLVPAVPAPQDAAAVADQGRDFTWFGNALLLLPQIEKLPLQVSGQWPALHRQPAIPLLRWLLLCVSQGANRFLAATLDPLLRTLCGVGTEHGLEEIVDWFNESLTPQQAVRFYAELKQQADDHGGTKGHRMECYRWQQGERCVVVHGETQKGRWIDLQVEPCNKALPAVPPPLDGEAQNLAMADFEVLWPPQRVGLDDPARACLVTLAQFALKSFAYRLPGFARSSVGHVLKNFLSMSATLVAEDQCIDAFLSRVPLSVMLNMAGINRGEIRLADYDPRPIRLMESA